MNLRVLGPDRIVVQYPTSPNRTMAAITLTGEARNTGTECIDAIGNY